MDLANIQILAVKPVDLWLVSTDTVAICTKYYCEGLLGRST